MNFFEQDMRKIAITTIYRFGDVEKALNMRDNIILMVDEAHRTQEGDYGEKMRLALPNAFFFGLTGTPINRLDKNTFKTFGAIEDKYVTDDPEGVNWIKIGDAGEDDVYIIRTSEKITQDGAKKSRAVKPGDFILSNSMSFGRPYILGIDGCVHDGWLIISDYQDYLDPMFFYYELRSDLVQRQFDGSANGSTVKNLNSDRVSKVKIHIPSMELQSEFVELAKQSDKSKFYG